MFRRASSLRVLFRSCAVVGAAIAVPSLSVFNTAQVARCESPMAGPGKDVGAALQTFEKIHTIEHELESFRPDPSKYERIDHVIFEEENFKGIREQHALYSSLHGENRIEAYEIYRSKESEEIYCIIKFGDKINGWPNVVHGGITALVIDNSFGWLFTTFKKPKAVTANLNINYRSPIMENSCSVLRAKIEKIEGKKLFMSARVENAATKRVQAESTTLFIFIQ